MRARWLRFLLKKSTPFLTIQNSAAAASHHLGEPARNVRVPVSFAPFADVLSFPLNQQILLGKYKFCFREDEQTYPAAVAEDDTAAISDGGLPDVGVGTETDRMRPAGGLAKVTHIST
jgi:hypothetical protein